MDVSNNTVNQQFEVLEGDHLASLQYRIRNGTFYFMHTEVPKSLGGKGIASLMAKTALEYARKNEYKIAVLCPFAVGYVTRHPEYYDMIDREYHGPYKFKLKET